MGTEEAITPSESNAVEAQNGGEYAIFLALGGLAGALLGIAIAHAIANRNRSKLNAKSGIKLAMVLVGAAREIASMMGE